MPGVFVNNGVHTSDAKAQDSDHAAPGNLVGDGRLALLDLGILLVAFGPCPQCAACPADFNDDGTVGASDLFILLGRWAGDRSNSQLGKVLRRIRPGRVGGRENFFCALRKIPSKPAYIPVAAPFGRWCDRALGLFGDLCSGTPGLQAPGLIDGEKPCDSR